MPKGIYKHKPHQGFQRGEKNPSFGKYPSEEIRRKISESHRGKPRSQTTKDKIRKSHIGLKPTEETLRKLKEVWIIRKLKGNYLTTKGRKHTEVAKKKMSEAAKQSYKQGRTNWNKGKPFFQIKGKNNPNWKGGITSLNMKIRESLEYKFWRKAVFERDNFTCIWCGYKGNKLCADHIKPFALFPELRFAIDNGRTLCEDCHRTTDTYAGKTHWKG